MFISRKEKEELFKRIANLEKKVRQLDQKPEKKKGMSEENKRKASIRMKAWHAQRKLEQRGN